MIFLFKWVPDTEKRPTQSFNDTDPDLFFAHQRVNNACATQAILSILMNRVQDVELGNELTQLRGFSMGLPFKERGEAIGAQDVIRT